MANRSQSYRRHKRGTTITRKKRIIKDGNDYWEFKFDGQLDKGKIHCSCSLCRGDDWGNKSDKHKYQEMKKISTKEIKQYT